MVNTGDLSALRAVTKRGDIQRAMQIYQADTGRLLSERSMQAFLQGTRYQGIRPGSHQPVDMYRAIAKAVAERQEREKRLNALVKDIRRSTFEAAQAAALV